MNENISVPDSIAIPVAKNEFSNLENDLQSKEKLFLKFWIGMSEVEFDTVSKILVKEGLLSGLRRDDLEYDVANANVNLIPVFEDDKLEAIQLSEAVDIYPALAEKYNLPNLTKKDIGVDSYIEPNPDFTSSLSFKNSQGRIIQLPYFFNEPISNYSAGEKIKAENIESVIPNSPQIVRKNNFVIVVNQEIKKSKAPITLYSLNNNEDVILFFAQQDYALDYFDKEKIISTKSRTKNVSTYNHAYLDIWYKSYAKFQKDSIYEKEHSVEALNNKFKNSDQKRKKAVYKDL